MLWNEECAAPSSLSHLNQFPLVEHKKSMCLELLNLDPNSIVEGMT